MNPGDPLARVLCIDLTRRSFEIKNRDDLFNRFLGGAGVAIQLLHEECPQGADPLGPDNPVIFAVGPLTGLFPLASKTVAMFKSPLTGNLGESHAGGRSAVSIRNAGFGALVIKGASAAPAYIAIHGQKVNFRDATALWGMRSSFTAGRIILEKEEGAGIRTLMRIGRAGERLVSYAGVTTETYRHFGRLGLGAVFGSKKLKAVVISGEAPLPVGEGYRTIYDEIYGAAVNSPVMKKYHDLGTAENVVPLNAMGGLPTRNLSAGRFEGAGNISGERLAEMHLGRRLACSHCPVGCVHIAALKEPYDNEPYFRKTTMISYDYELIYSLGTMLGISDAEAMLKLMDTVEIQGVDAMSAGVALAWATEALGKGLISQEHTLVPLAWGGAAAYGEAIGHIVDQTNDFYRALGKGVEYASAKYGGQEFAMAFGGNEMPGYHTGPGAALSFLMGSRHSHLDSGGYSIDQKSPGKSPEDLASALVEDERWRQVLSSLTICFFSRNLYTPEIIVRALEAAGFGTTVDALKVLGKDILKRKYEFKLREGFDPGKLRIPARTFETPAPGGKYDEAYLRRGIVAMTKLLE
jgi:aldehyde:ferredoxin oxidoreductase